MLFIFIRLFTLKKVRRRPRRHVVCNVYAQLVGEVSAQFFKANKLYTKRDTKKD